MKIVFFISVAILTCLSIECESIPPGHMQPLGSHMPPLEVEVLNSFPDPLSFHSKYVQRNLPVKLKGLMKDTDVLKNWQSDEYLRQKFGEESVGIDDSKKENRTERGRLELKMSEFLDRYQTEDIYMVSDMPKSMADEWPFPSFLLCGGYTENIAFVFVWLSSGGTKSVLHSDQIENLHCVVSGVKTFILIDKKYSEVIGSEYASQGHYNIDVDAVDMNRYPGLAKVPWYKAVIEPGDCLYLPYEWIHQVSSTERNMGINVWWIRFSFDKEDCAKSSQVHGFANIGQFRISSEIQIKGFLLDMKREDGTIHAVDVLNHQRKNTEAPVTLDQVIQAFEIMKPGCNGVLTEDDLTGTDISIEKYKEADNFIASILFDELIGQTPTPRNEEVEAGPLLPIIPPGGPPPDELGWEAEVIEEEHPPISRRDEL